MKLRCHPTGTGGPYKVLCQDMGRKLDTYKMLMKIINTILPVLKAKVKRDFGQTEKPAAHDQHSGS